MSRSSKPVLNWMQRVALSLFHKLICLYIIVIRRTDHIIIVSLTLVLIAWFCEHWDTSWPTFRKLLAISWSSK